MLQASQVTQTAQKFSLENQVLVEIFLVMLKINITKFLTNLKKLQKRKIVRANCLPYTKDQMGLFGDMAIICCKQPEKFN